MLHILVGVRTVAQSTSQCDEVQTHHAVGNAVLTLEEQLQCNMN